jgi:hypothetical protein
MDLSVSARQKSVESFMPRRPEAAAFFLQSAETMLAR